MNKETFNFDLKDTMSPEEVIIEDAKKNSGMHKRYGEL